jgi:hypothetical protein
MLGAVDLGIADHGGVFVNVCSGSWLCKNA